MILKVGCIECEDVIELEVDRQDFQNYSNGLVQVSVFSHLTEEELELIQSHICGKCWQKMFLSF
jgi:hypothetical protein